MEKAVLCSSSKSCNSSAGKRRANTSQLCSRHAPPILRIAGSRRTCNTEFKQPLASSATSPAIPTGQDIFTAGDVISSSNSADGPSALHGYCLEFVIRQGPRSTVWKASKLADGGRVVVKVLRTATPQQLAAAMQELQVTQKVAAAAGSGNAHEYRNTVQQSVVLAGQQCNSKDSSNTAKRVSPQQATQKPMSPHFASLLDSCVVQHGALSTLRQTPRQHHVQGSGAVDSAATRTHEHTTSKAAESCTHPSSLVATAVSAGSGTGGSSEQCAAVALVLEPLHQSLSWVLHYVRERQGRMGLPPQVVRSIAHQLLSGLAELHDEHAVVHRDIKPSNLLLRQPFVVHKGRHKMRTMTLQELSSAQWSVIDLGSATHLLPASQPPLPAASTGSSSSSNVNSGSSPDSSWIAGVSKKVQQLIGGPVQPGTAAAAAATAAAAASPSAQHWTVAEGAMVPYETPAYTPPEALLHLPATAAYDIWSAACCIYEAATGRLLFPVESAAAARRLQVPHWAPTTASGAAAAAAAGAVQSDSDKAEDDADGFEFDQLHLQMMKRVCGGPTPQLLRRSPYASDLFADTERCLLWIEDEEGKAAHCKQHLIFANALGFWGIGGKQQQPCRPVLHQLMAARNMPLNEAVALADFLQPMLAWDPQQRPTAAQLLQHPYFRPFPEKLLPQKQQEQP